MRLRILAAALALPLALSGALTACGGDPVAPPPLTPATFTASSPTPTEQAETAEEFIRRWVAVDTKMQNTGDTAGYRAISEPMCTACDGLADQIEAIYGRGGIVQTDGFEIVAIDRRGVGSPATYDVSVHSAPTSVKPRSGAAWQHLNGGDFTYELVLSRTPGSWKIRSIAQVAQ